MPSHVVAVGDSYASISTRFYGDPSGAALIKSANPGAGDPPSPGSVVNVPNVPPLITPPAPASVGVDPSETELRINASRFRFWERVEITRSLDAVDTIDFVTPRAETPEFRAVVRPLSYAPIDLLVGGASIFKGTMLTVDGGSNAEDSSTVQVGGYSLPGVLEDCTPPASSFPLQFKGLDLHGIASALCLPFGLTVAPPLGDMGGTFKRVRVRPDQHVLSFLFDLARQRKVLIGSTPRGELLLRAPPTEGAPVVTFTEGERPALSFELQTSPQRYFSHLTCIRSNSRSTAGSQHTVANPLLPAVLRPMSAAIDDTGPGELPQAAEALAGRMLAEAVSVRVTACTWRDPAGALWEPGSTIRIDSAPSAFVYQPTNWILREVRLARTATEETAQLSLVLPGAFSGVLPAVLPWDA